MTDHECRRGQDFVRDSVSCCCTHRCSELVCWGSRSWDRCYPGELELMVGGGWCSVNENSIPLIISNSTLIDNKYFSWIWCQSHLWQSPLTALVLPMAGAAQPKNFIVKIRNYNTMAPTGQHDWYWLRWGAGGRALTSWFPWSTLTNPASTTTGWRPHLGSSRRSNRNPSICFLTIRLPELFGWKIGTKIYLRW